MCNVQAKTTFDSGTSTVIERCQVCDNDKLESVLFLGYLPPVNKMNLIGEKPKEQPSYPAQLLYCPKCHLVQLGLVVDAKILFPSEYPYTSSTTKILRDNFAELYEECSHVLPLDKDDLIVDIGSNDGNLLINFKDSHRVLGVTPEEIGKIAIERGIPTIIDYFRSEVVSEIINSHGKAKIVTATNVFAHIENVNDVLDNIIELMQPDGVFISESHYLLPLIETLQYDTIYHEHLRYYSLHSLKYLIESHGMEIFRTKRIPTHGGSIRVYAAQKGAYPIDKSVNDMLDAEKNTVVGMDALKKFASDTTLSKLKLNSLLDGIKAKGDRIYGISAPSRASTLINYCALDAGIVDSVLEIQGSHKIGKYMPGTLIPVEDEAKLYSDQPEYALIFSWHIADELIPKISSKGYKGKFIVPLPEPRIVG